VTRLAFRAYLLGSLKRRDFDGRFVTVEVAPDGVTLKGERGGFLHLPLERVARLRAGFTEGKYGPVYEARLWLDGEPAPLLFYPLEHQDRPAYAAAIRTIASALHARGGARLERGVNAIGAALGPALMGIVVAFGFFGASISADPPVWWHFVVIPLIPSVVLGALIWRAATRHWPKPVASPAELDVQLP
jgi:hypothetical protein